ncbi:hypothetical protein BH09BAC4_BH09BAC4_03090 [soil metagenome]
MVVERDCQQQLNVPAALWKVILVLPVGSDDVNRINAQTRVIAVWTVGRCHAKYKCNG